MATKNPFDLLDDDTEDPSLLIAAVEQQKLEKPKKAPVSAPAQPGKAAKHPTKPLPPAQAVREAKSEPGRGGGRGAGRGRGSGGFNRDSNFSDNSNGFSGLYIPSEEGGGKQTERHGYGGPRGSFRGGRGGGFNSGESGEGERPRRMYDRRSGTGRGNDFKREGAGRGNWGSPTDEVAPETEENVPEDEKNVSSEKQPGEEDAADAGKENAANEAEEKEPETKEMTLEEYEKILEEKRKALLVLKTEERKVDVKEFESMQQLSNKKSNDDIFIKLGSEKDRRKDAEKEERAKKVVSINEFLKPAEGERYYGTGRGRGRGRGPRGEHGSNTASNVPAPSIEDPGHFPSLGGK
ncbi:phospholipase A(1) DAD1 [Hibiscus syriacus]|uniref:Phospholipase A(1) DAD1 n=1 Tax=Hibiscus syriacus TaxID=106335 RepID=A0A6A2Y1W3_HIBSY|nr:RGG repeats nuclear RNA binding protein A-like [Hibiscus syriacus]KAE8661844.1 phospholipase A(1) DAD1 [Hibiscus syriacus]